MCGDDTTTEPVSERVFIVYRYTLGDYPLRATGSLLYVPELVEGAARGTHQWFLTGRIRRAESLMHPIQSTEPRRS